LVSSFERLQIPGMSRTRYLKGECQQCGGHLEFPVDTIGLQIPCPHCGQTTELLLAAPPQESGIPRRVILWTLGALIILALGLAGTLLALNQAQRLAARQKQPVSAQLQPPPQKTDEPTLKAGFSISPIHLEKVEGSSLVYAVGMVTNETDRQRFGVRVEIALVDPVGKKLGSAKDYQQVIEPHGRWGFKALVNEARATSAWLAAITEDN
jgi:hypothetical protein